MAQSDLNVIVTPYLILGAVVAVVLVIFAIVKLPQTGSGERQPLDIGGTFGRLFKNPLWVTGVIAQAFYVGAQIMCWTFIIQYAGATMGMSKADAQGYNIIAMIIDQETFMGLSGVRASFFLPFICFIAIALYALYGLYATKIKGHSAL